MGKGMLVNCFLRHVLCIYLKVQMIKTNSKCRISCPVKLNDINYLIDKFLSNYYLSYESQPLKSCINNTKMFYVSNDKSTLKFQIFGHKSSFRNEKFHITLLFEHFLVSFYILCLFLELFIPRRLIWSKDDHN